jgi:DNA polymerase-4
VNLVDRITRRMRAADRVGRTVVLRLRFDDWTRVTRSRTLTRATADTERILVAARELVGASFPMMRERGVTLVGFSIANLDDDDALQLTLPFDGRSDGVLDAVLDDVKEKFGSDAVTRAVLLGRDPGVSMPMLPD